MTSVLENSDGGLSTIYLPSNTKCDYFENKTSHFKVDLLKPIPIKAGSKIALSEIIYPNSIMNVYESMCQISLRRLDNQINPTTVETIPEKNYRSAEQLIRALKTVIKNHRMKSVVRLNKDTSLCEIKMEPGETMQIHRKLANILGFLETEEFTSTGITDKPELTNIAHVAKDTSLYRAQVVPDTTLLTFSLYIYSNLIENSHVGDSNVPILGIIHCDTDLKTRYTHRTVPILNFVPVIGNVLSHIEIKITDTTGDLIHFRFGKVIIKLILSQPS